MSRIYERDSYIRELTTRVTDAGTDDKGRPWVELEDTIFFPEEGGQNADTGDLVIEDELSVRRVRVLDGIISGRNTCSSVADEGGIRIRYLVSEPVPSGTQVLCRLDWDMRFDRMQNHSGEHIISGIMHRKFGVDNVGFHLSDAGFVTLDVNGALTYEQVIEAQNEANRAIYMNLPVRASFPSGEELKTIDYRSKIDIDGQVRLITIGGEEGSGPVDICACCAPHVSHTGEIGILKVFSVINWKGGVRISMLCGRRALEYINNEHDILTETARSMSTEAANVPEMVDSYRNEVMDLRARLASFREQALIDSIERLGDNGRYLFTDADFPATAMKNVYNTLTQRFEGFVGVFAGDDESGYRYNAGSRDRDSRELAALMRDKLGAKGGGSSDMIQGKVSAGRDRILKTIGGEQDGNT